MRTISCFHDLHLSGKTESTAAALILLAVLTFNDAASAFDGLPSTVDLIREAKSEHDRYEAAHGKVCDSCVTMIAKAKVWQGDIDGALQTAQRGFKSLNEFTAMLCVEIHLKRTGEIRRLPESVFEEINAVRLGYWQYRFEFAKKLYGLDRMEEAEAFLPTDDSGLLSTLFLIDFRVHAGECDLKKKRSANARQHFSEALSLLNRSPERRYLRDSEMFLRVARGLTAIDDQRGAEQCLTGLSGKLKVSLLPENLEKLKSGSGAGVLYLAKDIARMGGICVALGDRTRADHEFQSAQNLLSLPSTPEGGQEQSDFEIRDRLKAAIEIAEWQHEAGFETEAVKVIEQALDRSDAIKSSLTRHAFLKRAVEALCEIGRPSLAADVMERMDDEYWICSALCVIASAEFQHGDTDSAKARLVAASELCPKEPSRINRTSMWLEMAEVQTEMSDSANARKSFQSALAVSDAPDREEYHQLVCRAQIRLGYLVDAYRTLKLIRSRDDRCLPFAELALAASKAGQ